MIYTISGQIRGGKNNMRVSKTGKHYPQKDWAVWRTLVVYDLMSQRNLARERQVDFHVDAVIEYWPGDNRRRDTPAILDSIYHCLEQAYIIKDDALIKSCNFICHDKSEYARATIELIRR